MANSDRNPAMHTTAEKAQSVTDMYTHVERAESVIAMDTNVEMLKM